MGKFALTLLKWVVPVLALLAMLAGATMYGEARGSLKRQPEIDQAVEAKVKAETSVAVLKGQVEAYKDAGDKVELIRAELTTQNDLVATQILQRIGVVGQMFVTRTGDECKDARAVSDAYFNELDRGAK